MFDILDIQLSIPIGTSANQHLEMLRHALGLQFDLEDLEETAPKAVRVRIISAEEDYQTINDLETAIRERASVEQFPWQRFGGVRVGETETVLF